MKKSLLLIVSFIFSQVIVGQTSRTYTQADYEKACVFDYDSSYDTRLFKYFMVDNYFEYRDFYKFYDGLACVKMNDLWGFVDTKGKEIIPIKYTRVLPFSDGLAAVSLNYGKYGYVNTQGNLVIPAKYKIALSFSEGLASVKLDDKYGYIDKRGNLVIPAKYDKAFSFSEGLACVKMNGKYGYINKQGQTIIPFKYEIAGDFSDGLAGVGISEKLYGYINKQGKVVIPLDRYKFDILDPSCVRGFGQFRKGYMRKGINIYDKKGIDISNYYKDISYIHSMYNGIYIYRYNEKEGLKKTDGTIILPASYDHISGYEKGEKEYFCVNKERKAGAIDLNGKEILPCKYSVVRDWSDGMFFVQRDKKKTDGYDDVKYSFVDSNGREVAPFVFDNAYGFKEGRAIVVINKKMGIIDKSGAPINIDLSGETMYRMGEECESNWKPNDPTTDKHLQEALNWYQKGANKGNKFSCFKVGFYKIQGTRNIQKNYLEAAKWLEKGISIEGETNGNEYFYLGSLYREGGYGLTKNETKAINYCTEGARIKKNAECYNVLAYIYASKKNYNLALDNINKAIEVTSNNIDKANYYDSKGEIYLMMDKTNEAIQMWNKVMELDKDHLDFYKQTSELYKQLKAKGKIK